MNADRSLDETCEWKAEGRPEAPRLDLPASTETLSPETARHLEDQDVIRSSTRDLAGRNLGQYQLISFVGKGGMGEVYRGIDLTRNSPVAIKLLPAEFTEDRHRLSRFAQEARAASALSHPNIVRIFDFADSEFGKYLVMEFIEGRSLRSCPRPLEAAAIGRIGRQVAAALEVTHAAGLVHRDLKPENIMVRADGLVKVLDFGLARLTDPPAGSVETELTVPGTILGTVNYMSPEQARGDRLTSASDIFSLGIVFYELTTGSHPFDADSRIGLMHSIVSRQAIPPSHLNPEIPVWLEALLLNMLEKDPARRCTAVDLVAAFSQAKRTSANTQVGPCPTARHIIGRRTEREELNAALQDVTGGKSLLVCISGEAGQGKTTLIEDFLLEIAKRETALIARGRCAERLSGVGAYLPVLESIESLLGDREREMVAGTMKSLAPTWYAQIVSRAPGQRSESSQEMLKRELAAMLHEISRQKPLVIFLDDVHWSDLSTIDLLSYMGAHFDGTRILIVVAYRTAELHANDSSFLQLKRELQTRGVCREIPLGFFSVSEIRELIDYRFPGHQFPGELAEKLKQRTEGNPLFISDLLQYLKARGAIEYKNGVWRITGPVDGLLTGTPDSVRHMVQRKMEQLGEEERRLLRAASIQGYDFDSAVLAHALDADPAELEERLEKLERRSGFVRLVDERELPDRTVTLRYSFVHALYHETFFASLHPARRSALSKAVAESLLHFHGVQSGKIAAQLSTLFEMARDFERAAANYHAAAQNALRLFAGIEAEELARRGLEAVQAIPATPERSRVELALHASLAMALSHQKTHASSEAVESHRRVQELSEECGDQTGAFFAQVGLFWACLSTCDFAGAQQRANDCLRIAEAAGDRVRMMQSRYLIGYASFHLADHTEAERTLREAIGLYDPAQDARLVETFGLDIRANGLANLGLNCWYRGFPLKAHARMEEAVALARATRHPLPLSVVLVSQAMLCDPLDDVNRMMEASEEVIAVAKMHGLERNTLFWGKFCRGWALTRMGEPAPGWEQMREAVAEAESVRMNLAFPGFGYALASSFMEHGMADEALAEVERYTPQAEQSGPREKLSELYRLKGEALFHKGLSDSGHEFLRRAVETAQRFGQRSNELRASLSLARLCRDKAESEAARVHLSNLFDGFTEGFDTPDLRKAKALIDSHGKVDAHVASA